jgi:hypothetical protein
MKLKEAVEKLNEMKLDGAELLIALPGGRFSPVTLVEPFTRVAEDKKEVKVVIVYPHPRDVSGPQAAPASDRPEWAKGIDAVFDFFEGAAKKTESSDE